MHPRSLTALSRGRAPLCALALSSACVALADPAEYVFVPYSTPGERQMAYAVGRTAGRDGQRETQQALSVGWNPSSRWYTAAYAAWASEDGGGYGFDEWSLLAHVQLTTPASGPFGIGLLCEISHPRDRADGDGLTCGPTLQLDTDDLQFNVNPRISRQVGAHSPEPARFGYQWQVKGLLTDHLEIGAQGFGDLGPWNRWAGRAEQSHTVGPALFARFAPGDGHEIRIDAAWLFGIGDGSPRNTLRLRMQRDF